MIKEAIKTVADEIQLIDWVERYGGLVSAVIKKDVIGDNGQTITKTFPVSDTTTAKECWEQGKYQSLIPNSNYSSVLYWEQLTALTNQQIIGAKKGVQELRARVRLVAWMNLPKLGLESAAGASAAFQLITKINGTRMMAAPNDNVKVRFEFLEKPQKDRALFSRYSYGDEIQNQLLYPYDYFALDFNLSIFVPLNCDFSITISEPLTCITL